MESPGAAVAHKLSGTSRSRVGTESLPQVTSWCISSATAGQLYKSGPICLQTNPSIATVLQLETRPAGGSSRCFPAGLEQGERLCQPSMVSDRSCPQKDQNTASTSGSCSPSLEEPGMVSGSPGDVDGLPSPHSTVGELVAEGTGSQGMDITPQLAVWPVSGKSTVVTAFQQKLRSSCWPPGGRSPHRHTTPCSEDGLAGVLKGIVIPF